MSLAVRKIAFVVFIFFSSASSAPSLAQEHSELVSNGVETAADNSWEKTIIDDTALTSSPLSGAFQMLLALLCVVALAYLVLHKGLGTILKRQRSGEIMKVKERLPLDGKHSLYLVDIEGKVLLLATGERGVQLLVPSLTPVQDNKGAQSRPSFAAIQNHTVTGA